MFLLWQHLWYQFLHLLGVQALLHVGMWNWQRRKALSSLPRLKSVCQGLWKLPACPLPLDVVHLWIDLDACVGACKACSTFLPSPPVSTATFCRGYSDFQIQTSTRLKATGKGGFEKRPDAQLMCQVTNIFLLGESRSGCLLNPSVDQLVFLFPLLLGSSDTL